MRRAIPYQGGELEATLDGETWTVRLGELKESSRYLDYALARLLDTDSRNVHNLAARLVEGLTAVAPTYVVEVEGADAEHLYRDERRQVIEREVLVVDGSNVVVEAVSQPDGERYGRIRARPMPTAGRPEPPR